MNITQKQLLESKEDHNQEQSFVDPKNHLYYGFALYVGKNYLDNVVQGIHTIGCASQSVTIGPTIQLKEYEEQSAGIFDLSIYCLHVAILLWIWLQKSKLPMSLQNSKEVLS